MIFNIVIILAVGVIAFFHYLQGFFSAAISAVLAAVAAFLALSFYEPVVDMLLGGKMADSAHGMVLLVLFAGVYMLLRAAFDSMIPGNLRMPALIDRVGGAVMGVVAGVFAVGIVAIAAQAMPLMPDVGGYTKYGVADNRPVRVPGTSNGRDKDALVFDELMSDDSGRFDEADRKSLIIPVDDILVGLVKQHSGGGALAGSRPLTDVHPDLLQEYFGQRLGIQTGAQRVIINNAAKGKTAIKGAELFRLDTIPQVDASYEVMRLPTRKPKVPPELRANANQVLLVARVMLGRDAGDAKTFIMRFSPGSVRLVAKRIGASGELETVNYFPVGTIDGANKLVANRLDDFCFIDLRSGDKGIDFAFLADAKGLLASSPPAGSAQAAGSPAPPSKIAPGVFLEINRMARVKLGDKGVKPASQYKPNKDIDVMRQRPLAPPPPPAPVTPVEVVPPPKPLKEKLVGTWTGSVNNEPLTMTFNADGSVAFKFGNRPDATGTWTFVSEAGTSMKIKRQLANGAPSDTTINFSNDDTMTMVADTGAKTDMTRKK
jgi:uncharacterized membrane protein required for colicin V production